MDSVLKLFGVGVSLLAGYLFLHLSPYRRYRAEHLRTDRFTLQVLGYSFALYALGSVANSIITQRYCGGFAEQFLASVEQYSGLQASVILTLVLAPIAAGLDNFILLARMCDNRVVTQHSFFTNPVVRTRAAAAARFVLKCDDAATRTLYRATIGRKPLMLTLKSGKVYVGQPVGEMRDPSLLAGSIRLIPVASGYRDPSTHKVNFTTAYKDMGRRIRPIENEQKARGDDPLASDLAELTITDSEKVKIDMQDLGVIVFWSEVQSLTIFNEDLYRAFQSTDT